MWSVVVGCAGEGKGVVEGGRSAVAGRLPGWVGVLNYVSYMDLEGAIVILTKIRLLILRRRCMQLGLGHAFDPLHATISTVHLKIT